MIIKREGKEYQLSEQELLAAYREQEKLFRLEDVRLHVNDLNEWECKDSYGVIITDHLQEMFLADEGIQEDVLEKFDSLFDCNRAENDMWQDAIKGVVREMETALHKDVIEAIEEMEIPEDERLAMKTSDDLVNKAAVLVFREECDVLDAIDKVKESFIFLRFEGKDSHNRPVYSMVDGRLIADCDSRSWVHNGKLCTKLCNAFDGEPDTPLSVLYPDAVYGYYPERVTV